MGDLLDTEIHPGQGESGDIFIPTSKAGCKILDHIMARQSTVSKPTFRVMVRRTSAAARKIWKSKSATSWSCETKSRR